VAWFDFWTHQASTSMSSVPMTTPFSPGATTVMSSQEKR
jgi:hypothetical protein